MKKNAYKEFKYSLWNIAGPQEMVASFKYINKSELYLNIASSWREQ